MCILPDERTKAIGVVAAASVLWGVTSLRTAVKMGEHLTWGPFHIPDDVTLTPERVSAAIKLVEYSPDDPFAHVLNAVRLQAFKNEGPPDV